MNSHPKTMGGFVRPNKNPSLMLPTEHGPISASARRSHHEVHGTFNVDRAGGLSLAMADRSAMAELGGREKRKLLTSHFQFISYFIAGAMVFYRYKHKNGAES